MKTTLFILFLATFGLWAQIPPSPDATTGTNSEVRLRQALREALLGRGTTAAAKPSTPGSVPMPSALTQSNSLAIPGGQAVPGGFPPAPALQPGVAAANPSAAALAAGAATTNAPTEEIIPAGGIINFKGADLPQVLQVYAELVNRTILRPATLPAPQITLQTQTPLTKHEAIAALDAVLGMNGITMINVGEKFVKAVQQENSFKEGMAFTTNQSISYPDLGPYVTHVVQLKYVKPSEMVPVLQGFMKIPNAVLPIDASQILVLRDYSENVKRMLEMIERIDISVPSEFVSEVIPIKYALSSDIASALNSLGSGGGGGATVGSSGGAGRTGATGSRGGMGGMGGMGSRSGLGGYGGASGGYGGAGGYGGGTMPGMGSQLGAQGAVGAAAPGTTGNAFTDRLRNIISRAAGTGDFQIFGQTKMIADERTNSLLIYATKEDMKIIKDIIAKLDVVLAQVLIEAVIVEVTLNNSRDLGFSYQEGRTHGVGNYFNGIGAINNGNALSLSSFASGVGTNAAGSAPSGFSYLGMLGGDLDVTMTAIANDSRARIVQRPRIQTSHAVPAHIFVGQSRPYPTGSYYGGAAYGSYSSIQQLQIGVSLDVTPLINPDGLVVMDIQQEIDNFTGTVNITGVGDVPITSSKSASAKVAVRDRDTIMLGGLIETDKTDSNAGVPLLKDIPGLGFLFRSNSKQDSQSELIVLIRPTVLPTPEVAALTATSERNRMPGVKRAMQEVQQDMEKQLKETDRQMMKGQYK